MGTAAAPAAEALRQGGFATTIRQPGRTPPALWAESVRTPNPRCRSFEKILADPEASVRIEAALATWFITGQPTHADVIVKALGDKSAHVKDAACRAVSGR